MKLLYFAIELNLILWLALIGVLFATGTDVGTVKTIAIVGVVLSALVQHCAYYRLRAANNTTA